MQSRSGHREALPARYIHGRCLSHVEEIEKNKLYKERHTNAVRHENRSMAEFEVMVIGDKEEFDYR